MPSPPMTDLPRPKSWDEFEDICADVLRRLWKDPYIVRNGRSGQGQHGVDIYGQPHHLKGTAPGGYAGAQCKRVDRLELPTVEAEVEQAESFQPRLSEYLVMTTAARDSHLQEEVRTQDWPFRVMVLFWDDISLELSGHDDLLQKHFPGWMRRPTTEEQVLNRVLSSQPEDFRYDDSTGVLFHKFDVSLRIVYERGEESDKEFHEPWAERFPDPHATRQPVYIYYGETRVKEVLCAYVDGGRCVIPCPRSRTDLTLTRFCYHIGCILNHHTPWNAFESALKCAGITVREEDAESSVARDGEA